jgi:hypothetical protein
MNAPAFVRALRRIVFIKNYVTRPAVGTCCVAAAILAGPAAAHAQVDIVTNRYDGARSGANLSEKTLTTANVNVNQFGKLYSYPVDGGVYAQPLYLTGVTIGGAVRNVLYVVTMNDKAYAFDADSSSPTPLWMTNFTKPPAVTAVPMTDIVSPTYNIKGNVGIESTPVIDRATGTMYLVVRTKENGAYVQRLHALDVKTGLAKFGSPHTITGAVPGTAADSATSASGRTVAFDPKMHQQRAALALTNGVVLVAWAGHEDKLPYHGWIMGFDAATLAPVGVFAVTPDGYGGGIWQGGRAPTIDAGGNAYFATGNAKWDGSRNYGDSLLKFTVTRAGMKLVDYFTPGNEATLNVNDDDLSGSGFTLLPGANLLLGGGKEGILYLLDPNDLGRKVANDTQIPQKVAVNGGHVMGGPVFWNSATAGPLVYNWGEDDVLVAYRLSGGRLTAPYAHGTARSPGHPGGSLTISANGTAANTGIVWASIPTSQNAKWARVAGMLRAYNADTLQEIWTTEQNPGRDRLGTTIKFVPPVVASGKVYMANDDNGVAVYGLLSSILAPGGTVDTRQPVSPEEVVLYAKNASPIGGAWRIVTDATAAGGARIEHPDAGKAKVPAALAAPSDYFELTFTAKANIPYHLWLRGRAQGNSYSNDSVYLQFSGTVTNTGTPTNRIGTTEAATVVLEDCSGCGLAGWGWQDNGFGAGVVGPAMYFSAGVQRIRVQGREDGISVDQIVLSPALYLTKSPGALKNDGTIVSQPAQPTTETIVRHAASASTIAGNWRVVADATAAGGSLIEQPNAGVPKVATPLANPTNYFEVTFTAEANTPYRLWLRGRAAADSYSNDSVYVQFSGSVTSTGAAINRIRTTEAMPIVLEDCSGCGLAGWGWQDTGFGTGVLGPVVYFTAGPQTLRIQGREDGISLDQIVLSPDRYLTTPPGPTKHDATVMSKTP